MNGVQVTMEESSKAKSREEPSAALDSATELPKDRGPASQPDRLTQIESLGRGEGLVLPDLPMSVYHNPETGLSKTGMSKIDKVSPYEYKWSSEQKSEPSKAFLVGTLFHTLFLEPHKFDAEYAVFDGEGRRGTKAWKAFEDANKGKILLKKEELAEAEKMRDDALKNTLTKDIYKAKGEAEASYFCRESEHGVLLKCRPDKFIPEKSWVVDVKTTKNPFPFEKNGFKKEAYIYGYYLSASLTLRVMELVLGVRPSEYFYLAVSNAAPYRSFLYRATEEEIMLGDAIVDKTLPVYAKALRTGVWSDFPDVIYDCGLPEWADGYDEIMAKMDLSFDDFRSKYAG